MVRFLISAAFSGATLIRVRLIIEGSAYSDLDVNDAALIRRNTVLWFLKLVSGLQ